MQTDRPTATDLPFCILTARVLRALHFIHLILNGDELIIAIQVLSETLSLYVYYAFFIAFYKV